MAKAVHHHADKKEQKHHDVSINTKELPEILAWASGDIIRFPFKEEEPSDKDIKMKSLAVMRLSDTGVYAPVSGVITLLDLKHNKISIENPSGLVLGLKVCKSCISMDTEGKALVSKGDKVQAKEKLFDFDKHLHAKSKLLLGDPMKTRQFDALGYKPAHECDLIEAGTLLLEREEAQMTDSSESKTDEQAKTE